MENELNQIAAQMVYTEEKKELWKKTGFLVGCILIISLVFKIMSDDATLFEILEVAVPLAMMLYLPFKIGVTLSGSIFIGLIAAFAVVIAVGLLIGDNNLLLVLIFFGGCVFDFGCSIWKMRKAKKQMAEETVVIVDATE